MATWNELNRSFGSANAIGTQAPQGGSGWGALNAENERRRKEQEEEQKRREAEQAAPKNRVKELEASGEQSMWNLKNLAAGFKEVTTRLSENVGLRARSAGEDTNVINHAIAKKLVSPSPEERDEAVKLVEEATKKAKKNDPREVEARRERLLVGGLVSGATGNIIPQAEVPETVGEKVIAGSGQLVGTVASIGAIEATLTNAATKVGTLNRLAATYPKVAAYARNIGAFDIYGQLNPELGTDVQKRAKQAAYDTVLGIIYQVAGLSSKRRYSVPAAAVVTYGAAKHQGASTEDALVQAGLIGILALTHGKTPGARLDGERGKLVETEIQKALALPENNPVLRGPNGLEMRVERPQELLFTDPETLPENPQAARELVTVRDVLPKAPTEKTVQPTEPKVVKSELQQRIDRIREKNEKNAQLIPEGSRRQATLKGDAMKLAAVQRKIEGRATPIEMEKAKEYLDSYHSGRSAKIGTDEVTLTGKTSFGRHEVRYADGRKTFFERSKITVKKPTDGDVVAYLKEVGNKELLGQEQLYGLDKEPLKPPLAVEEPSQRIEAASFPKPGLETKLSPSLTRTIEPGGASKSMRYTSPSQLYSREVGDAIYADYSKVSRLAQENKPAFTDDIARATGLEPDVRIKKQDSFNGKVERYKIMGWNPKDIADVLAGRIVVKMDDVSQQMANLQKNFIVQETQDFFKTPSGWGYQGVNMQVRLPNGQLAEVQIHTPESLEVANKIHPLYEKWRDVDFNELKKNSPEKFEEMKSDHARSVEISREFFSETVAPKPVETKNDTFTSLVFERLKQEHPESLKGDLEATRVNMETDAKKAVELIATDKQKAFNIAMGAETAKDVTSTSVNIAMAEKALDERNYQLYARLVKNRSLEQTRRGQELVAEKGSVTDNSTSRYVKELISARLEKLGSKYLGELRVRKTPKARATEAIDAEVKKVEKQIRSKKFTTKDALVLLDKLACV
jgi:ppGpp synthetase/RelA/SpoT-type nucleotidyltranferase